MKILVTGVKGQLDHDVANGLAERGIEAVGVDIEGIDITDAASRRRCASDPYESNRKQSAV